MDNQTGRKARWGVLLLNTGAPNGGDDLRDFLFRLFSDPYILPLPKFARRGLAHLIAFFRVRRASKRYALIGGESPLLAETEKQRAALEETLSLPVAVGMRYSRPSIHDGVSSLKRRDIDHLVLLPLYPQFSLTTTQSALDYFEKSGDWKGPVCVIDHHFDHPSFVSAHREMLKEQMDTVSSSEKTAVLFVAHSIPLSRIRQGDPYVLQVESTVSLISRRIDSSIILRTAYQSQVRPVKWQGPSLERVLEDLVRSGVTRLIVHPLSFASENLETIYDLDIDFKQKCRDRGLDFIRVPAPGTHLKYIEALSSSVEDGIRSWELEHA